MHILKKLASLCELWQEWIVEEDLYLADTWKVLLKKAVSFLFKNLKNEGDLNYI
jgi:hypothetical protein